MQFCWLKSIGVTYLCLSVLDMIQRNAMSGSTQLEMNSNQKINADGKYVYTKLKNKIYIAVVAPVVTIELFMEKLQEIS